MESQFTFSSLTLLALTSGKHFHINPDYFNMETLNKVVTVFISGYNGIDYLISVLIIIK